MRYKGYGQRSVLDELLDNRKGKQKKTQDFLSEIDEYIDWGIYRQLIEKSYRQSAYGPGRYDLLLLFKMVMLQQWHGLSDRETEEYIADRLSFRKFLGLSVQDDVPDETTICLFRKHLVETGLYDWLFERMQTELDKRHLLVKKGAMIDATFIQAPRRKKTDPEAKTGHKGHGYSMHTHVDIGSKLVRELEMTSAEEHDSQEQENLLFGDEQSLWADKAYFNDEKKREMREAGVYCGILDKAKRNHPLSNKQKKRNIQKSRVRAAVEHPYAQMKQHQNYRRTRYRGLEKNRYHATVQVMAYNFKRMMFLLKKQAKKVVEEIVKVIEIETRAYCANLG